MSNWNPNPKDIEALCDAISSHYVEEDYYSADYCIHCGQRWGNVRTKYWDKDLVEPHYPGCAVLIAKDVMTGFGT